MIHSSNMNPTIVVVFCTFSLFFVTDGTLAPTRLFLTRVGPCYDNLNNTVTISEMILKGELYETLLYGQINISKDLDNGWILKATMQKCHDIRNLDTCDFFKAFVVMKSGCEGDDDESQDFNDIFLQYVRPRLGCPLKAGNYEISSLPFLSEYRAPSAAGSSISTSVFGYTLRLEGFAEDEDERIFCADAYVQLRYIRDHNWVGGVDPDPTTSQPAKKHLNDGTTDRNRGREE